MKQTIDIPDLPDGYKAVAYRSPKRGEKYLFMGTIFKAICDEKRPYLIVQKTKPRRIDDYDPSSPNGFD